MYRATLALIAALLLVGALAACSDKTSASASKKTAGAPKVSTTAATPKKLADTYTAKLDAVSDGSVAHCQSPSSTACSNDVGAIMVVVDDLQTDIDTHGGASKYPKTTQQIAKMRAAQQEYGDNGCEGDPLADDPNSDCWGVVGITVGSSILSMTLQTDELS